MADCKLSEGFVQHCNCWIGVSRGTTVASPSSYSLRCSSLQNPLRRKAFNGSTILRILFTGFHPHATAAYLLILGATKIPPFAIAVTTTRPGTLSIEQQTISVQKLRKATL